MAAVLIEQMDLDPGRIPLGLGAQHSGDGRGSGRRGVSFPARLNDRPASAREPLPLASKAIRTQSAGLSAVCAPVSGSRRPSALSRRTSNSTRSRLPSPRSRSRDDRGVARRAASGEPSSVSSALTVSRDCRFDVSALLAVAAHRILLAYTGQGDFFSASGDATADMRPWVCRIGKLGMKPHLARIRRLSDQVARPARARTSGAGFRGAIGRGQGLCALRRPRPIPQCQALGPEDSRHSSCILRPGSCGRARARLGFRDGSSCPASASPSKLGSAGYWAIGVVAAGLACRISRRRRRIRDRP